MERPNYSPQTATVNPEHERLLASREVGRRTQVDTHTSVPLAHAIAQCWHHDYNEIEVSDTIDHLNTVPLDQITILMAEGGAIC